MARRRWPFVSNLSEKGGLYGNYDNEKIITDIFLQLIFLASK
jgi:hypothetical protein